MHAGYGVPFIAYIVLATLLTVCSLNCSTAVCIVVEVIDDCNRIPRPAIQVSGMVMATSANSSHSLIPDFPYHPKSEFWFSKRSFNCFFTLTLARTTFFYKQYLSILMVN